MERSLQQLTSQFPQHGRLDAIFLRPQRREPCIQVSETVAEADVGLKGDHKQGGKRQVSLIQAEHLGLIAAFLGRTAIDPILLRRNLVISGINLISLKPLFPELILQVRIGEALIEVSGDCEPCSRMEELLGTGGYNAMRGHGGMVARIVESGRIRVGDAVSAIVATRQTTLI